MAWRSRLLKAKGRKIANLAAFPQTKMSISRSHTPAKIAGIALRM